MTWPAAEVCVRVCVYQRPRETVRRAVDTAAHPEDVVSNFVEGKHLIDRVANVGALRLVQLKVANELGGGGRGGGGGGGGGGRKGV